MLDAHAESTAVKLSASVLNAFSACAMSLSELHPSPGYTTHFGPPSVEQETMNVEDLMTLAPHVCRPKDSLHAAAQLMWRHDCGTLPVVDDDSHLVGMITDRDICMGGYIQHQSLTRLRVDQSMAHNVVTCRADDDIAAAAQVMAEHQVRRLPVVDGDDRVVGVLSLCDVVRAGRAGLEPTAERIAELSNFGPQQLSDGGPVMPARAIHRDLDGRHAALFIGPVPREAIRAYDTNPTTRGA